MDILHPMRVIFQTIAKADNEELTNLKNILDNVPSVIFALDPHGQPVYRNKAWQDLTGEESTYGMISDTHHLVHPDDAAMFLKQKVDGLGAEKLFSMEFRIRKADGQYTWLQSWLNPQRDEHGKVIRWLGACFDINAAKMREEQKRFFLNAVSHDLRTPLNAISLAAEMVKAAEGDQSMLDQASTQITEQVHAAATLLDNLLDFARLQSGANVKISMRVHKVSDILLGVLHSFDRAAQKKGLYLKAPLTSKATVITEMSRAQRVLNNLVDNAIKFTKKGGVEVTLKDEGDFLVFNVSDSGCGIACDHQTRLFEEFFQVSNHERNRSKGFGLGLAIARDLARSIGGELRLERSGPTGTVFALRLPKGEQSTVRASQTQSATG